MPRAAFDTTVDFIYGPSGVIPGAVYETQNCRLVPLLFSPIGPSPLDQITAYVTLDGPPPNLASVVPLGEIFTSDYSFADRLAIPHGAAANYVVRWVELVAYRSHPPYYRVYVSPI